MIDWLLNHWWQVWLYGGLSLYFPLLGFIAMIAPAEDHKEATDVGFTMFFVAFGCILWPLVPLAIPFGIGYWMLTYKHRHANKTVSARAS